MKHGLAVLALILHTIVKLHDFQVVLFSLREPHIVWELPFGQQAHRMQAFGLIDEAF